jgi:hypothetical protein
MNEANEAGRVRARIAHAFASLSALLGVLCFSIATLTISIGDSGQGLSGLCLSIAFLAMARLRSRLRRLQLSRWLRRIPRPRLRSLLFLDR